MNLSTISALSPLDGRYAGRLAPLRPLMSEHGYMHRRVQVEVDIAEGLPAFTIVGLPDATVQEARERVKSAVRNAGFHFPAHRITVNLAPADLRKEGVFFDLPVALGILKASGQLQVPLDGYVFLGDAVYNPSTIHLTQLLLDDGCRFERHGKGQPHPR